MLDGRDRLAGHHTQRYVPYLPNGVRMRSAPVKTPTDSCTRLLQGDPAEFSCLLGTLVQETFHTHSALQAA